MGIPATGSNFLLGRGNLFIDRWAAGVRTGAYRFLGNVPKMEVTIEDETLEKYSSTEAVRPLVLSVVTKRTPKVSIALDEFQLENVALGLMGASATYSQTTGAVTGEVMTTSVVKGQIYGTVNRRITAITVKKAPSTALVLGTDYIVRDAERGLIEILASGATLVNGDGVNIDYTKGTITNESKIAGGSNTVIDASLIYIPDNANGPKDEYEFWHVQMQVDGAVGLITEDDTGQFSLTAKVISDATLHAAEPYFRVIRRP